jgi:hypothetical protein
MQETHPDAARPDADPRSTRGGVASWLVAALGAGIAAVSTALHVDRPASASEGALSLLIVLWSASPFLVLVALSRVPRLRPLLPVAGALLLAADLLAKWDYVIGDGPWTDATVVLVAPLWELFVLGPLCMVLSFAARGVWRRMRR